MKKYLSNLKKKWKNFLILSSLFIETIFPDKNEKEVKQFFRCYFEENDLSPSIWQLHHVGVKTKREKNMPNDTVIVTVTLGRPGLFIGKGGRTFDDIIERLSRWLDQPVKIKIKEYDPLKIIY